MPSAVTGSLHDPHPLSPFACTPEQSEGAPGSPQTSIYPFKLSPGEEENHEGGTGAATPHLSLLGPPPVALHSSAQRYEERRRHGDVRWTVELPTPPQRPARRA